jgi:hypothetical protein
MRKLTALLLAGIGVVGAAAFAHAHDELSSAQFVDSLRQADFIFEGVVTSVEYKSSRPTGARDRPLPHTFVTYEVLKVYKGRPGAPRTVTLRFMGGVSEINGRYLEVGTFPLFDVGAHDIVMMQGNTRNACPLALCGQGRFRIIGEKVYSDQGHEVDLTPDGTMAYGPPQPLPEIDTHVIEVRTADPRAGGRHVVGRTYLEPNVDGVLAPPVPLPAPQGWRQMTSAQFDTFLVNAIRSNLSPAELRSVPPVVSADIRNDFHVNLMTEHAPRSVPPGLGKTPPRSREEERELERHRADDDDEGRSQR